MPLLANVRWIGTLNSRSFSTCWMTILTISPPWLDSATISFAPKSNAAFTAACDHLDGPPLVLLSHMT